MERLLFVRFYLNAKFHCLCVGLEKRIGFLRNFPIVPTKQVLDRANFDRFLLVIAQLDFEGFVHPVIVGIDLEIGPAAFTYQIERVAGINPHDLVFGRVIDQVFAGESL